MSENYPLLAELKTAATKIALGFKAHDIEEVANSGLHAVELLRSASKDELTAMNEYIDSIGNVEPETGSLFISINGGLVVGDKLSREQLLNHAAEILEVRGIEKDLEEEDTKKSYAANLQRGTSLRGGGSHNSGYVAAENIRAAERGDQSHGR